MATIFFPCSPPEDRPPEPPHLGVLPPDVFQQMRPSDTLQPLQSFSEESGWGGEVAKLGKWISVFGGEEMHKG